jgi:FKBP-type peptidyl-prolyl cis-trans isomerase
MIMIGSLLPFSSQKTSSVSFARPFFGIILTIVFPLLLLLLIVWNDTANAAFIVTPTVPKNNNLLQKKHQNNIDILSSSSLGPVARNGLQYEDIEIGTGRRVLPGDAVLCYYVGTYQQQAKAGLSKKTVTFDETEPGEPAEFVIGKGQVIPGWDLGIGGDLSLEIPPMKIGGDRKLVVPAALAYGDRQVGPIPANQDLEFQIMIINAQPTGGVSTSTQIKGFAGLLSVLSLFAVLGLYIAQNYNNWF